MLLLLLIWGELRCGYRVDRGIPDFLLLLHRYRVEDNGEISLLVAEETIVVC